MSCAFWAKKLNPERHVGLLELNRIGYGASTKNAGFLTKGSFSYYHHLEASYGEKIAHNFFSFGHDSIQLAHDFILKDSSLEFTPTSSLTLSTHVLQHNPFFHEVDHLYSDKFSRRAHLSPGEVKINPQTFIHHLKTMCEKMGVVIHENVVVDKKNCDGLQSQIIFCLNAYTGSFLENFQTKISPYRGQMLEMQIQDGHSFDHLFYYPEERVYWRFYQDKIWIGGKRLVDEERETTMDMGINSVIQLELEDFVRTKLNLRATVTRQWSGIMGFTKNERPICQRLEQENQYLLAGFSGHGMGYGFKSAKELVEHLDDKQKEPFFFNPLRDKIES